MTRCGQENVPRFYQPGSSWRHDASIFGDATARGVIREHGKCRVPRRPGESRAGAPDLPEIATSRRYVSSGRRRSSGISPRSSTSGCNCLMHLRRTLQQCTVTHRFRAQRGFCRMRRRQLLPRTHILAATGSRNGAPRRLKAFIAAIVIVRSTRSFGENAAETFA